MRDKGKLPIRKNTVSRSFTSICPATTTRGGIVEVRAIAVVEHTLLYLLSDAEERKDLARTSSVGGSACRDHKRE